MHPFHFLNKFVKSCSFCFANFRHICVNSQQNSSRIVTVLHLCYTCMTPVLQPITIITCEQSLTTCNSTNLAFPAMSCGQLKPRFCTVTCALPVYKITTVVSNGPYVSTIQIHLCFCGFMRIHVNVFINSNMDKLQACTSSAYPK